MADEQDTVQDAQSDETPQAKVGEDVVKVAEDAAETAIPIAVEDAATDGAAAGVEAGLDAAAVVVEQEAPKVLAEGYDELKAWVRKEIELLQAGHSAETRKTQNP